MHGIDINNTVFITAITAVNETRLKEDPPAEAVCNDPIAIAAGYRLDNEVLRRARRYDYYNDIKALSIRTGGKCYHMITRENMTSPSIIIPDNVVVCDDELAILRELWERNCLMNATVAGWRMDDFLPMLVYKGIWYRLNVEDRFKMDPTSSAYPSIPGILRVETIYQQHVRDNARRPLPSFEEICLWWNIPLPWTAPYLTRDVLSKLTPKEWVERGFKSIENTLFAQEYLVRAYYGYK